MAHRYSHLTSQQADIYQNATSSLLFGVEELSVGQGLGEPWGFTGKGMEG